MKSDMLNYWLNLIRYKRKLIKNNIQIFINPFKLASKKMA